MIRKLLASLFVGWLLISFLIMELHNTTIAIFLLISMGSVTLFVISWIIQGGLNSIIDIITPPRTNNVGEKSETGVEYDEKKSD